MLQPPLAGNIYSSSLEGVMAYDDERAAKRIRLEQTSFFECQSVSPCHNETDLKYNDRNSALDHQYLLEDPTLFVPSEDNETSNNDRSRYLQSEQFEATRLSPSLSHATFPQKSQCFTDSADLVCFGSVGAIPYHS